MRQDIKIFYPKKKPFISEDNRIIRLNWAKKYKTKSPSFWRNVLWSDESLFHFIWQNRNRVWRTQVDNPYDSNLTSGTVKRHSKIMVWGCFSYYGVGKLYKIEGRMDAKAYHKILQSQMFPSAKKLFKDQKWIFQQDNDPKHKANTIKKYLKNKNQEVLDWPSQSPDLNCIENLWSILNQKCKNRYCTTKEQTFNDLNTAWSQIPLNTLQILVDSMPNRIQAVIDSNGGPTRY